MPRKKTQSLTQFIAEIQKNVKDFEADYRKHNKEDPENYPLEIPKNNSGLWFEFFVDFCNQA
jgi:hypothetical protein